MESLAVDGVVVYRRKDDPTIAARSARRSKDPRSNGVAGRASAASIEDSAAEEPEVARLSEDDPAFEEKRKLLISAGYRWNKARSEWVRARDSVRA